MRVSGQIESTFLSDLLSWVMLVLSAEIRRLGYKIAALVAGVRYIAIPTIAAALFSYRRAAQLAKQVFE
jgi:hypothetical protein